MKVGIDTFGCDHGRSGIGSYLISLVSKLPEEKGLEYELFGTEMDRYTYSGDKNISYSSANVPDSITAERFWHFFNVNSFAKKHDYSVVLYTAGARLYPKKISVPGVVVINAILSNMISSTNDVWFKKSVVKSLSNADSIIAASLYIKKDLERLGVENEHIEVIHNGIDHSMFYPSSIVNDEFIEIKPFAIKRPYFIYPSRLQSSEKKHIELIKAFTLFKEKTHLPHRLVMAGADGPYSEQIHKAAYQSAASNDIFLTGYFPHDTFPDLYRGAEACIFPSVNEGVGLPVLEAMAAGLPVACAKAGALPEIAGNNALYFDSDNIDEMASVMEKVAVDTECRSSLIEGSLEWTKRFSWEKTADLTLNVLKETASRKS